MLVLKVKFYIKLIIWWHDLVNSNSKFLLHIVNTHVSPWSIEVFFSGYKFRFLSWQTLIIRWYSPIHFSFGCWDYNRSRLLKQYFIGFNSSLALHHLPHITISWSSILDQPRAFSTVVQTCPKYLQSLLERLHVGYLLGTSS